MEFNNSFIKIWVVLLIVLILVVMGQITSNKIANVTSFMGCEDYTYNIQVNVIPTHLAVYTMDNGVQEYFKTDDAYTNIFSTILHCGHSYRVIYSSEGYENYTEEFEVGKYIKINPLSKPIKLESELKLINLIEK